MHELQRFLDDLLKVFLLAVILWGGAATAQETAGGATGMAPEFPPDLLWLNSDRPLSLRDLRGKVVLLDFWTYGCINCMHVIPDLQRREAEFGDELVVIGVHSAKYDNETILANIRQAIQRYGITHPVVNDRDLSIWKAYRVFGWPTQIVIDPQGRQLQGFVGENHYERLHHLIATTIDTHRRMGTLRTGDFAWQRTATPEASTVLRYPGKVLADAATARLFIADTNHHRILITDLQGRVQIVIGQGPAGSRDGPLATATFCQPQGMALRGQRLYVADTGNHLIRRVDLSQGVVTTSAGTGEKAHEFNVPGYSRKVALNSPWALYTRDHILYIAMAGMHQLWRMDLNTAYLEPFSGSGKEDLLDGDHAEAALGQPSGLSGDGRRLYVADSEVNAVRAADLDPQGSITTLAGGGLFTFGDVEGVGHEARLQHPLGVAYTADTVYIADTYNHKIKLLTLTDGRVQTLAGTGTAGYRDGPGHEAQFYEQGGLSVRAGQLYVADTNNHRLRVIDLTTHMVTTLPIEVPGAEVPGAPDEVSITHLQNSCCQHCQRSRCISFPNRPLSGK
jgi:sugar lactone lactonase YvrE/thiol-disulfide isomerase/thioredoxin